MRGGIGTAMESHVLPIASTANSVLRVANLEAVGRIIPTRLLVAVMFHTVGIPTAVRDKKARRPQSLDSNLTSDYHS